MNMVTLFETIKAKKLKTRSSQKCISKCPFHTSILYKYWIRHTIRKTIALPKRMKRENFMARAIISVEPNAMKIA